MPCYDVQLENTKEVRAPVTDRHSLFSVVLTGNPNVGKTTLFNALTGLKARTANFPGTTVEHRACNLDAGGHQVELIDLPGIYSLKAATPEERIANDLIHGKAHGIAKPDAMIVVANASNIERSLFLISQLLENDLPTIVVLNMIDIANRHGIHVDADKLSAELGCLVLPTIAKSNHGIDQLKDEIVRLMDHVPRVTKFAGPSVAHCDSCGGCPFQSRYSWSEGVAARCVNTPGVARGSRTEKIDKVLTHPIMGLASFAVVMLALFYLIFSVATVPMDLIDSLFARVGVFVARVVPAGDLRSLLVDGIVGGVGGMLVFLPQICILFFFLGLLEDSGYLARAAFVMDRLMGRIGLPGTAFVPLLSAHACAVPAIMSTRVIQDPRDRLVTILVAPLMTCSARIPVYAMVTALLFPKSPAHAALVFTGAYLLGIFAALLMAFIFKKTILPGDSKPLVLELPEYKVPGLRTIFLYTWDRAKVFIQQAGTIILMISVILWGLATYPKSEVPVHALELTRQANAAELQGLTEKAESLNKEADSFSCQYALSRSFAGRLGKLIEPVVRPLGFDWQIGIGIITSFAAREVIVSTLAVVYGLGDDAVGDSPDGLYATMRKAHRSDGTPVFTAATSLSLLVFYVLAMQCLPTQAVTRRETNSWKWPIFQFAYMTVLAYGASLFTFQFLKAIGVS